MAQPGKQEKQDAAVKEAIVKEENLIFLSLKCEHKSASDYLAHMRKEYRVVIGEEEEEIIRGIDFEAFYGKTLQILIVKGVVFQDLYMYLTETKRGAELLGYSTPPVISACLLFERAIVDEKLKCFRYIVPMHDEVDDSIHTPCLLCVSNDADALSLMTYYDEPIAGSYANREDAYAFSALTICP